MKKLLLLTTTCALWASSPAFAQIGPYQRNVPGGVAGTDANNTISGQSAIAAGGTASALLSALFALNESIYFTGALCGSSSTAHADGAAINAMLAAKAAAGGGRVTLPPKLCYSDVTITIPSGVILVGEGPNPSSITTTVANPNPLVLISGNNSGIEYLDINPSGPSQATSGTALSFAPASSYSTAHHVTIINPCNGVDINGGINKVIDLNINGVQGSGCNGVRVGPATTGGGTVDATITRMNVTGAQGNPPNSGLLVSDSGGLLLDDSNVSFTGTIFKPGLNQQIVWSTVKHSYLGDSGPGPLLLIDTAHASAVIRGNTFTDDWTSTSATTGVTIRNTAGGTVDGLHFVNHRAFNNAGNAFENYGGTDVSLDVSNICGTSSSGSDVVLGAGFGIRATGGHWGAACDGFGAATAIGLLFLGSGSVVNITGVDMTGPTSPIAGSPGGASIMANNQPSSITPQSLTAAATTTLSAYENYTISGTTTVSTINGGWTGRTVRLIPSAATPFTTGGNIATAYTATVNVPITAYYNGATWFLK